MQENRRPIPLAALGDNLKRLCWIRWIVLVMQGMALVYSPNTESVDIRIDVLLTVVALYALVNAFTLGRLGYGKSRFPVTEWEFFGHLLFDIAVLSLFLYFTGGSTNPFISFFLVPISISAATLPSFYTWTMTGLTAALYFLMLHYYVPVDWFAADHRQNTSGAFNPHILGMWFNFIASAVLITYFVVRMAKALRDHDQALNKAHEDMLRNEQVVAVATQAAGTAHRLGTPLSTMTVLLDELKSEHASNRRLHEDLDLLIEQVDRCKETLHGLIDAARRRTTADRQHSPAADYFAAVIDEWRILHPRVRITIDSRVSDTAQLEHEETLDQAVTHLLDNAVEAGSGTVEISMTGDARNVYFRVRDHGPGIPADQINRLGEPFITTKKKGFGLGLFLSHATVARYHGDIALSNHEQGGTVAELRLPLTGPQP